MAKSIRWQIPFVSDIDKTKYRIDIYDEGTFTPVQLAGGPTPFVTNENNDTDFFAPVRSQTGTIQVCTAIPGGGTLSLNDILPANNIARPVRLVSISGSTETIEWQGFLSCEAYSQDYIGIPQVLDIPVISVLEAMDSVEMDMTLVTGIKKTRFFIYYALTELDRQCGMTDPFFSTIFYSRASSNFMQQYIDATVLYSVNEYTNEESYSYVVSGMSCKQAIERVCKFMGWVIREKGTSVFLNRASDELTVYQQDLSNINQGDTIFINSRSQVSYTSANISDQVWRGTGHKKNLTQGAKSVEVVANLIRYDMEMGMPEIPTDSLQHYDAGVLEAWATMDNEFNNMLTFLYYQMTVRETSGGYDLYQSGDADIEDAFADCVVSPDCDVDEQYPRQTNGTAYVCIKNCGAYVGRFNFSGQGETNWIDGLYVVAANEMQAANHVPTIFKMDSIISYTLIDGSLKLTVHGITIMMDGTRIADFMGTAYFKLRFGNKYWNGNNWQTSETFFEADFDNDAEEDEEPGDYILNIPITSQLTGSVTLEIGGGIRGGSQHEGYYQPDYDLLFTELKLEHVEAEYVEKSEHSENKYFRLLGGNFRDEVSVSTELASSLNNRPSPSLVMQDTNTAMRYLNYITTSAGATEPRRPEVDLLDRLAAYYGAARQRLELEVAHPTAAPLPLLKLNGIGDSKVYLPLSESRDWKADSCKLTCFETPN
jgi:hypothetical protein